jgi:hypothetical protein
MVQLSHEVDITGVSPKATQIVIVLEQWVTWEAVHGSEFQPFDRPLCIVHKGERYSDVVGGVMEVTEPLSLLYG